MDMLSKLSRNAQIVLGAAVLYLIISFFDWQQVSFLSTSVGDNEWHGIGFVAGLVVLVLLAWEIARLMQMNITVGQLSPGLISFGLAAILLVLTIITFIDKSTARHWPAWVGLVLSFVIAFFAFQRSKEEGVELPSMPSSTPPSGGGGSSS